MTHRSIASLLASLALFAAPAVCAAQTTAAPSAVPAAEQPVAAPASEATEAAPSEPATPAPPSSSAQYASVQKELAQVMEDLIQARARVAVLGKTLFKTKVRVRLDNRAAPEQVVLRAALWLDGAPIWKGDASALTDPERVLFEGFAIPGPHVLTLEIEQRARDDEAYRYTLRESYRFKVLRDRRTDLRVVLDDDSDMAEDFDEDQEGQYEVNTRFTVQATKLGDD